MKLYQIDYSPLVELLQHGFDPSWTKRVNEGQQEQKDEDEDAEPAAPIYQPSFLDQARASRREEQENPLTDLPMMQSFINDGFGLNRLAAKGSAHSTAASILPLTPRTLASSLDRHPSAAGWSSHCRSRIHRRRLS